MSHLPTIAFPASVLPPGRPWQVACLCPEISCFACSLAPCKLCNGGQGSSLPPTSTIAMSVNFYPSVCNLVLCKKFSFEACCPIPVQEKALFELSAGPSGHAGFCARCKHKRTFHSIRAASRRLTPLYRAVQSCWQAQMSWWSRIWADPNLGGPPVRCSGGAWDILTPIFWIPLFLKSLCFQDLKVRCSSFPPAPAFLLPPPAVSDPSAPSIPVRHAVSHCMVVKCVQVNRFQWMSSVKLNSTSSRVCGVGVQDLQNGLRRRPRTAPCLCSVVSA